MEENKMSEWRVFSAQVDIVTGKFLLTGEKLITKEEWVDTYSDLMRERNFEEQTVYDNIQKLNEGDDE